MLLKKLLYRIFQGGMRLLIPFLPYREPRKLPSPEAIAQTILGHGCRCVLLVTDRGVLRAGLTQAIEAALSTSGIALVRYADTAANPTTDNVEAALALYRENGCGAIVAVGGGSAMDCAKAVGARCARPEKSLGQMKGVLKVRKKIPPLFAVPTTAGTGSETTVAAVITDSETREKYAVNDFVLIPQYAMLDARLTLTLPNSVTATTGMDALTHAIEAYIGRSTTKKTRAWAEEAVRTVFENLPVCFRNGSDLEARRAMLEASYLAGLAFTKSYVGYVHALAHALGGKYNVPHGLANAVLLPIVLRAYGPAVRKKLLLLGAASGLFPLSTPKDAAAEAFICKIEAMNADMDIPKTLSCIKREDIAELAETAEREAAPLYPVPVLWTKEQLSGVLLSASDGA